MELHSIVVYSQLNTKPIIVTENHLGDFTDKIITSELAPRTDAKLLRNENIRFNIPFRIYPTFYNDYFYYGFVVDSQKKIFIATMSEIAGENLALLFNAIDQAGSNESDLFLILKNPKKYAATKINQVQESLHETQQLLLSGIDKVIERGENIESLIVKTEELAENQGSFRLPKKRTGFFYSLFCAKHIEDESKEPFLSPTRHFRSSST